MVSVLVRAVVVAVEELGEDHQEPLQVEDHGPKKDPLEQGRTS